MIEINLFEVLVWIAGFLVLAQVLFNMNINSDIRYLKRENSRLKYELEELKRKVRGEEEE